MAPAGRGGARASDSDGAVSPAGVERAKTRRVRRQVMKLRSCIGALGERQRRFLALRAGLSRSQGMSREGAARRSGVRASAARRFERRALRALRKAARSGSCGGQGRESARRGAATGSAVPAAYAKPDVPSARVSTTGSGSGGDGHGERLQAVGGTTASGGGDGSGGGDRRTPIAPPTAADAGPAAPLPSSLIPAMIAGLAGLVALFLVRRRTAAAGGGGAGGFAAIGATAATAVGDPAGAARSHGRGDPAGADRSRGRGSRALALDALNDGDVEAAAEVVHPDVTWTAGPGHRPLRGRSEFRDYWIEQLSTAEIQFVPLTFETGDAELRVLLHECERNRTGSGGYGEFHARRHFRFRDGLIAEMTRGTSASVIIGGRARRLSTLPRRSGEGIEPSKRGAATPCRF